MSILEIIQNAPKESEIYHMTEKIAYWLHTRNKSKEANMNWLLAQKKLSYFVKNFNYLNTETKLEMALKKSHENNAYRFSKIKGCDVSMNIQERSPLTNWVLAQDSLANQIIDSKY